MYDTPLPALACWAAVFMAAGSGRFPLQEDANGGVGIKQARRGLRIPADQVNLRCAVIFHKLSITLPITVLTG